ncbi:HNH endonuclease [Caballeronia sp. LZ001]|uniref:HNH endonuclease n=1 Tax=Caballeronia sp. LZ001 TaxID=3038553 RepID=UPI002861B6D7|nr:HNH endonuclease [Caballeronia sp. LZ001]MDR5802146.1 HNH endonuclease [Caballeronia sp. LZ001]
MKIIKTRRGEEIKVDDADFEELSVFTWSISSRGYARRNVRSNRKNGVEYMHRRLMWLTPGGKVEVDHINGDRLDNRRENMRLCTRQQNLWNRGRLSTNTSGFKGVTRASYGSRWVAQIDAHGKHYYIGTYDTPEEAHLAYCSKARQFFGEFAYPSAQTSV